MTSGMSEQSAVQDPMVKYSQQIGWESISSADAVLERGSESGLFLRGVLATQLQRLNPGVVDANQADEIIRRLSLLPATIEGNRDILSWLRGEQSIFVPTENRQINVRLIDFERPDLNVFHVTKEWRYVGPAFTNRADVIFLINGIPVALAETKDAKKLSALAEGIDQVRRYHRETPQILLAPQVFEVTQLMDFYYGATWATSRKDLFNWKDDGPGGDYETRVKAFFDRQRCLRVLQTYIIFLSKDDVLSKVILRQHQTRAVERVLARVAEPAKHRGLVWHTQGSGKTLTMLTIASRLLREAPGGEKPTVLMLVDRNELEEQLFKNVLGYGIGTYRVAESKAHLREILRAGYRGLVISTIHKFDDMPADLATRSSIVVLVDEAHRTTGGDLGNYLLGALPNATYIGFTGTPIDRTSHGAGTFKVFGVDDPQGYLDKYSIAESIQDGTTVALNYALAPSELRVERETLEKEFLSLAQAEGVADIEELNAILDRAVALKELMKNHDRVDRIARHVADHFKETIEPMGFKAFLVAVDREACALYKEALDKYLPAEDSVVVYSPAHNDSELLKRHQIDPAREPNVRRDFRQKGTQPKILIVTEKLLTGFDAPILYCLYLDKPMRDHVLLQALARVNRPYEDDDGLVKPYGFIFDYVGLFEDLEGALAFDSDEVQSVIQNIDVLKDLFAKRMRDEAPEYLPLTRGWDDKAKERAIAHFADKDLREKFLNWLRQLQSLYEVLSPDASLRPYLDDYLALSELFGLIRFAYGDRQYVDKELTEKTKALLREHSAGGAIELPGAVQSLGPDEIAALKTNDTSPETKVLNLRKLLARKVRDESGSQPFLVSIGERAEELADAYQAGQLTTQQALSAFLKLAEQTAQAQTERAELGLDPNTYAIYTALKSLGDGTTPEHARAVERVFAEFPDFAWDGGQASQLRARLYKVLMPLVGRERLIQAADTLLRIERT